MAPGITRRTLLTALAGVPLADVEAVAYAAFRIVRAEAGDPSVPELILPAGYSIVPGAAYTAASRAEFLQFIQGGRRRRPASRCRSAGPASRWRRSSTARSG